MSRFDEIGKSVPLYSAAANEIYREEIAALKAQLIERDRAIAEFCARSAWAVESWKRQPHIKALFDLAGKKEG